MQPAEAARDDTISMLRSYAVVQCIRSVLNTEEGMGGAIDDKSNAVG